MGERQRVCSKECSKKRRREQARQRREQDLDQYRAEERERQSVCRERRAGSARAAPAGQAAPEVPSSPESHAASAGSEPIRAVTAAMSRAEFGSQEPEISKELLILWDHQARLSRADFARKISQWLGSRGGLLGCLGS